MDNRRTYTVKVDGYVMMILDAALAACSPKADSEYVAHAELSELFQHISLGSQQVEIEGVGNLGVPQITVDEVTVTEPQYIFLRQAFKAARAKPIYIPAVSKFVVMAMNAVKSAEVVPGKHENNGSKNLKIVNKDRVKV